jgi:hypothetical protein
MGGLSYSYPGGCNMKINDLVGYGERGVDGHLNFTELWVGEYERIY